MSENSGFTGTHLFVAFLAGAATGAAVALLTTPSTGAENRERLRHTYEKAKAKLSRSASTEPETEG